MTSKWIPEILYEENEEGLSSKIPFIQVPENERMPGIIFIFESKETGEFEPGLNGEEVPVVELDLHQYANMATLKEKLDGYSYDICRKALGLEPLAVATRKGKVTAEKVASNLKEINTGNFSIE